MHFSRVAVGLLVLMMTVDATIFIGTAGTVGVGAAVGLAALAGVAGLAIGAGVVGGLALGGRRRGRGRGKRDVVVQQQTDMVLDMVAAADAYGCALKLVCLVESKPEDQLTAEDELILQLFGNSPAEVTEEQVNTPRKAYFYAAYLGDSQGKDACQKVFHTCEASYGQMMAYVSALTN